MSEQRVRKTIFIKGKRAGEVDVKAGYGEGLRLRNAIARVFGKTAIDRKSRA